MEDHKKKLSAITAVLYYIQSEEEAVIQQADSGPPCATPPNPSELWSFSGRHYNMVMRNLIQLRSFPGMKL